MGADIQEFAGRSLELVDETSGGAGLGQRGNPRRQRVAQQRGQRLTFPLQKAEPPFDIAHDVPHVQDAAVRDEHQAMRLDRPRQVDRLLIAERQAGHSFDCAQDSGIERRFGRRNFVLGDCSTRLGQCGQRASSSKETARAAPRGPYTWNGRGE